MIDLDTNGMPPETIAALETLAEVHADFAVECTAAMTELRALVQALDHRARILEIEVASLKGELASVRGLAMRN